MPTLTVHMASMGTPLANGKTSKFGHMWYTLDDGSGGSSLSYGFAPITAKSGWPIGPGQTFSDDNSQYLNTDPTKPIISNSIYITQAEYDALQDFGNHPAYYGFSTYYDGLDNSCVDFVWKGMEVAGFNNAKFQGAMLPQWNKEAVQQVWDAVQATYLPDWTAVIEVDETGRVTVLPICGREQTRVSGSVNTSFTAARNLVIRYDPLILDLDGDGLELAGATGAVLFDHNADGIKTGTGWVHPDDGLLVRDLDGNGVIDTGRELFGVDTIKSDGALAANGFDALKDLDSDGDGFITSADAAFGELRVWQDANQDGISQAGELNTLASLGITSIGLDGSAAGPQAGQVINGNRVALSATFTRDGQTRTVGSVDLEANNFFAEFPAEITSNRWSVRFRLNPLSTGCCASNWNPSSRYKNART